MRVRTAYTEKRRQMRFTRRKFPAALNLKALIMLDSGDYYGQTGKNARAVEVMPN
ncbi:TPA: hypothetical protein JAX41_004736 [Enterobacter roggenkampii]|nr:hypothetical protein [Enterobacter roggenkampii]